MSESIAGKKCAYDREMKKISAAVRRILPFFLLAAVFLGTLLYPQTKNSTQGEERARVVHIWNVDTFEGGKGSRTAFLSRVARLAERESEGVYYRVLSYTAEGAKAAMSEGEFPDLLSFGVGLGVSEERCLAFSVSALSGSRKAVPWCRGEYVLFSLSDDFSDDLSSESDAAAETVISVGGENLSCAAAYFADISGTEEESLAAYLDFLGGKYRYLLGTQRDTARFAARGVNVYRRELPAYCDLYQYIAFLSEDLRAECLRFIGILYSEEVQSTLSEIGMLPVEGAEGLTVSAFSDQAQLDEARAAVRSGSAEKNPQKFFEFI